MRIIRLQMENIKKIKALEITPEGNTVILSGKNGSGKSSVLDSISWAFEGLAKIQNKPIRYGESKGWIKIDLGDYTIERTFKLDEHGEYTSKLFVTSPDGAEYKSPQAVIEKCFNSLSFNPLEFSNTDKKTQLEMLESLVPGFDFEDSRLKEKAAYDERTVANRNAKDSSLKHVSFKDVFVAEPEVVDVKALTAALTGVAERNAASFKVIADKKDALKTVEQAMQDCVRAIETQQAIIALANKLIGEKTAEKLVLSAMHLKASAIVEPVIEDIASIKADLDAAVVKNDLHDKWKQKKKAKDDIEAYEKQSAELTTQIEQIQKERFNAIALAKLPAGLAFDSNGVTLNGLPFEQASSAEQLEASVGIAMAANTELRVIRIQDGSLLDSDGMALIARMADQHGCQVWIERVGSGEVGFELVDGELKQ